MNDYSLHQFRFKIDCFQNLNFCLQLEERDCYLNEKVSTDNGLVGKVVLFLIMYIVECNHFKGRKLIAHLFKIINK
jgi:hypothetical protein